MPVLTTVQKQLILSSIALALCAASFGQSNLTAGNFEKEILKYEPVNSSSLSEKDFEFAAMVIGEIKLAAADDPEGFNRADYFNVLTAFLVLQETDENILLAYEKFANSDGACEYFTSFGKKVNEKKTYAPIRDRFNARAMECEKGAKPKEIFDLASYCREHKLNKDLVALIQLIDAKDQKYRGDDYKTRAPDQKIIDIQNQVCIDSLFEAHNTYIGESLVGPKFETTMWAVIQHSNPEMMKQYLPILQKAVANDGLAESTLKMTIDRYYALTYGYQVFGSQSGMNVALANTEKREEIAKLYGVMH